MKPIFRFLKPIIYVVVLAVLSSCKKEPEGGMIKPDDNNNNNNPWGSSINLNISGKVLDDATGNPVVGATVKAGTVSTTTDDNGIFILKNAPGKSSLALVQVEKTGYFPGSRSFLPLSGGGNLRIRLLPKVLTGSIPSLGGMVSHSSGAELMLEAGSVSKNGVAYSGNVKVFLQSIDPTTVDFESRMPGNLIAMDGNAARGLKSFGMLAAELQDESGQELQIASGKKAHLKFPIPAGLRATAADSIDLWSYDEANGYWKKEGRAGKEGDFYHAEVSHFSFWNCDVPFNLIEINGRILSNGLPLSGAKITITSQGMGSQSTLSNADGRFGGFVPKDEVLSLKVEAGCGTFTEVYSGNIGPFASNATLSNISVNIPNATFVSGNISGCNNASISGTYVVANGQAYFADEAGNFSFSACGNSLSIRAYGSNPWTEGNSETIGLSGSNATVNLQVCDNGGNIGTVTDIDGNVYSTDTIGTQIWMQENLKVSKYRNGEAIPTNLADAAWQTANSGAYAIYNNDTANNTSHGKLYNFYAVSDPRGLCPAGWHVPTDLEWTSLENFLGTSIVAGGKMKSAGMIEAGTGLWHAPNKDATNSSGFTALPGGLRGGIGTFTSLGSYGYWWSSTQDLSTSAWSRYLGNDISNSGRYDWSKTLGFSVRCLKN